MTKIILSELDFARIQKSIKEAEQSKSISKSEAESLSKELSDAKIVAPKEIPNDVVTMNSKVTITFLKNKKQIELNIVYPSEADSSKNKISIFSPIAAALIGNKIGDTIDWIVPSGPTNIRIDEISYQPESAGDFDL
ncbi:MAG TPA: nucleoside diphosphate kinase regulator [Balneolaceae bacterium]|nr:nucleoside diphosphate kinase regulator [Balneolaceae bacterium]